MIVVDANLVAYFWLPTPFSEETEKLAEHQGEWVTTELCKSEFRNILGKYIKKGFLTVAQATWIADQKEKKFEFGYYAVSSEEVLSLVSSSSCSAYDCEYVALARKFNVPLITYDKQILSEFPKVAKTVTQYLSEIS